MTAFHVQDPDFEQSLMTGMTRKHWIDAGIHLLGGVFEHIDSLGDPIALPKRPGKTYPKPDDPAWKFRSAEFEGLSRTLMIAGPIIENDPSAEAAGINLRDHYAQLILRATDPDDPHFVGFITNLAREHKQPLFQHTAEGAALALGLLYTREQIWERFSQPEKDQVAAVFQDYIANKTNSHNWRFFNVMMAGFLKLNGYEIDEQVLRDHLQNLMAFYAGDGWYRDMGQFDYYSCWAFQFYGPIWARHFGYEHMPEVAEIIEKRHQKLMEHYPLMFGRNGHSLMWGRSIIYRCAASAPFPAHFLLNNPTVDPGWARRIASGNLLQFITRKDFYHEGVPTLGFYREFDPLVQGYSCRLSPFWLAKVFLALHLPETSPFWSAEESEGDWSTLGDAIKTVSLPGPGLTITADGRTGISHTAPGKVASKKQNPNYTRLSYNSAFSWEEECPDGGTAMAYSVLQSGYDLPFMAHQNLKYIGMRDGVLYRQCDLPGWLARVDLAEIAIPGGVLRVDRVSIPYKHELTLGHFGLPHFNGKPADVSPIGADGVEGLSAHIDLRQVVLMPIAGWDGITSAVHEGLHPEAPQSTVIYCRHKEEKDYAGMFLAVTVMLCSKEPEDWKWTSDQLMPITEHEVLPWTDSGHPLGSKLTLKDGRSFTIDYGHVMGERSS
ncbi:MAG: DUF2264 domain-containing protein [Phycisphaerae bacterium]